MVAFPDHRKTAHETAAPQGAPRSALARLAMGCAGTGLCMAGLGLWLVPSSDPAAQLAKLCASLLLLGWGAYVLHARKNAPKADVHIAPDRHGPRVREYDARGRSVLRHR
ncbi:hypothetical protein [Roseovarius aestuariivivens]|uniref:hypothetical protein n=1 Tax=Roseovarius aestuariivivens TaxID=1888910 RepID=UPI001080F6F7|nr:hypothetical protein [Roseovarius aestuariivivens]